MEKAYCPFCGKKELADIDTVKHRDIINRNKKFFEYVKKITSPTFYLKEGMHRIIMKQRICEHCKVPVVSLAGES